MDHQDISGKHFMMQTLSIQLFLECTLFPKRNATLISRFFMVTLDQRQ